MTTSSVCTPRRWRTSRRATPRVQRKLASGALPPCNGIRTVGAFVESEANLLAVLGQARLAEGDADSAADALRRAETLFGDLVDADYSPARARAGRMRNRVAGN